MSRTSEIAAVAATVWDQERHSEADLAFLEALAAADRCCTDTLSRSNICWGVNSEQHQLVKNLAYRQREVAYRNALAQLNAAEEADIMGDALQAAE